MKSLWRLSFFLLLVAYALPLTAMAQVSTSSSGVAPTCTMSVRPTSINVGGSVTLTWSSTNATGGAITNVGNVGPSGSKNLLPSSASFTTYIGSFTGPRGTANCSATVRVSSGGGGVGGTGDAEFNTETPTLGTDGGTQNATLGDTTGAPAPIGAAPVTTIPTNTTGGALVTCGTGVFDPANPTASATGCQACDLASLIQNIINFLIGISIPLAAALFAWAGVLYFTSAGDHHKIEQAKGIFKNAFIGFIIIICSWLVINTVLHVLFSQGSFAGGNWFTIQCSSASNPRPVSGSIGDVLGRLLGSAQVTNNVVSDVSFNDRFNGASSGPMYGCAAGWDLSGTECYNPESGEVKPATAGYQNTSGSPALTNAQMGQEIANACAQYGMSSSACALASSIAYNESGGGRNCKTSDTGAAGCMQVLATTACGLDSSISSSCGACLSSRQSLSAACAPVIATVSGDTQLGTNLGVKYINNMYAQYNGSCQLAAAAYFQGPGNVQKYGGVPPLANTYVAKACK